METHDLPEGQSIDQRKIAFAQGADIANVIQILREGADQRPLVGDTEYETVVNAVRLDAQSDLINKFINNIDSIKKGGLFQKP